MIKRAIVTTLVIVLVLAQSTFAEAAFASDRLAGPFIAEADLETGITPIANLTVTIKNIPDGGGTDTTKLGWLGVTLGAGWKKSVQYLEVDYAANQKGWGVQIYTDNMNGTLPYRYTGGNPMTDPSKQPTGLISEDGKIACPMAILVTDNVVNFANIAEPVQNSETGNNIYFTTGYDEIAGGDHEKVWMWLKDKNSTKWVDADNDGQIDAGEITKTLSTTGDDYATIVNPYGSSSGWSGPTGEMQRDNRSTKPICVYVAAKFNTAQIMQMYTTNTITLEIYHESTP